MPLDHLGLAPGWIEKGPAVLIVLLFLLINTGRAGNKTTCAAPCSTG